MLNTTPVILTFKEKVIKKRRETKEIYLQNEKDEKLLRMKRTNKNKSLWKATMKMMRHVFTATGKLMVATMSNMSKIDSL